MRCGPFLPDGYARDPLVVAEVLSHSTMSNDRGRKSEFYKGLQTLRTFLLVYQDEVRVEVRVEVWQKERSSWNFTVLGPEGTIDLPELQATLPVGELYAGIENS